MADITEQTVLLSAPITVPITIPASSTDTAAGTDLLTLINAGLAARDSDYTLPGQFRFKINKYDPGDPTTDRAAFIVLGLVPGDTFDGALFATDGEPVAAGEAYEPPIANAGGLYVQAVADATISATVTIYP